MAVALSTTSIPAAETATAELIVDAGHPGAAISPSLYGIFFEELNHAGDGGLYAEMVRGRSFPGDEMGGWSLRGSGKLSIDSGRPLNAAHPRSLRMDASGNQDAAVNEGYWGMALKKGEEYRLSFFARGQGELEARLETAGGTVCGRAGITGLGPEWKRFECILQSGAPTASGRLVILPRAAGTVWLNVISLFPLDTWKKRPNGLRPDLANLLAEMKPAFVRFPGGCYVEGGLHVRDAFRWKKTVGDISERPGHSNEYWGYWSTDGLGYHEYLQMTEDLGAEPMFVVNCGMAHEDVVPMDKLNEWVQEALDGIEYANGPATDKWGALRAKHGHPEPFGLKYVEIGNENHGPNYEERYAVFYQAIKARYPDMILIANSTVNSAPIDIIDHHIYASPESMRLACKRYDGYDRKSPRVFVGEYACSRNVGGGNLNAALAEAAYMMGFERNADAVVMSAYAPLFDNVNDPRVPFNLVRFDSARSFCTPSYWVQVLFARNRGSEVLPVKLESGQERVPLRIDRGAIGVGTWATQAEFKDIKVAQGDKLLFASDFSKGANDWRAAGGDWQVKDGAYCQMSDAANVRSVAGSADWTDYTLTLKGRKLSGSQGFLVLFRVKDARNLFWLNIGGLGNNSTGIERLYDGARTRLPESAPIPIETGRWYDIRIDVAGSRIECFLDGAPILKVADAYSGVTLPLMEAVASRDTKIGEIVLKAVNFSDRPQKTSVRLEGVRNVASAGVAKVLTSARLQDENTMEESMKVAPVSKNVAGLDARFEYVFPPRSLTVLRIVERRS